MNTNNGDKNVTLAIERSSCPAFRLLLSNSEVAARAILKAVEENKSPPVGIIY